MIVTRQKLEATIHFAPARRLVYLNNAKVACSSIKKALWLAFDPESFDPNRGPHDRVTAPFCRTLEDIAADIDAFMSATFFAVVRNPYARLLSAYLDKISINDGGHSKPRDTSVWHPFCRRYRLSASATPTFREFLQMVTSEDPSLIDQHFAPQHINILHSFASCDFIGHMEEMIDVWRFLAPFGVKEAEHRPHNTTANTSIAEFYGPEEIELVRSSYAEDFDLFGYSDDPFVPTPVREVHQAKRPRNLVRTLIQGYTAEHQDSRQRCIDAIGSAVPGLLTDYNALENGSVSMSRLVEISNSAIRGEISNWKLVSRIGEELLRNNMVFEAASVVGRAKILMYGTR